MFVQGTRYGRNGAQGTKADCGNATAAHSFLKIQGFGKCGNQRSREWMALAPFRADQSKIFSLAFSGARHRREMIIVYDDSSHFVVCLIVRFFIRKKWPILGSSSNDKGSFGLFTHWALIGSLITSRLVGLYSLFDVQGRQGQSNRQFRFCLSMRCNWQLS